MTDRVRIFGRDGIALCDLRVTVERTWTINDEGEAEFDIVLSDPNCREDYLRFGNWLLVENDKLEPWVGMIDVPLAFKRRMAHVTAYTPDRQFIYRTVMRQLVLSGKSGFIFNEVLNMTNRAEQTVIAAGNIWMGGNDLPKENMCGDHLRDYLIGLYTAANAEVSFRPVVTNGQLTIYADWQRKIGESTVFELAEGYNLEDIDDPLRFQNAFHNELWGYGSGSGAADRPLATIRDPESAGKYGLRQGNVSYENYNDVGSVTAALKNQINLERLPLTVHQLAVLDVGETWNRLRMGNSYQVRQQLAGFGVRAQVRVKCMYFDPFQGKVELKGVEVVDDCSG